MMKKKKKLITILSVFVIFGLLYIGILHYKISLYSALEPQRNADYMIILGAKVNGTVPSLALKYRIQAAANYLKENKNTIAIASGGRGHGEDISEAEAIRENLVKQGISESRILIENQSTSTVENIKFSKELIPKNLKSGIIVTNNFHLFRSIMTAKDQNLDLSGIPAKTPKIIVVKSYIREYLAITKFYVERMLF